jgi:hypothetical protein
MKTLLLTILTTVLMVPLAANAATTLKAPGAYSGDAAMVTTVEKRRKKRVPGGSGCDDPHDIREHPECRR